MLQRIALALAVTLSSAQPIWSRYHRSAALDGKASVSGPQAGDSAVIWRRDIFPVSIYTELSVGTDGTVFYGTRGGSEGGGSVTALDPSKGTVKWEKSIMLNVMGIALASVPAGDILIFCDGLAYRKTPNTLYGVNASTGTQIWALSIEGHCNPPALSGTDVIVTTEVRIYVVDHRTGQLKWFQPYGYDIPAVLPGIGDSNGTIFANAQTIVYAIDAHNGQTVWKSVNFTRAILTGSNPALSPDRTMLFISMGEVAVDNATSGDLTEERGGVIYALSTKDGSILWSTPMVEACDPRAGGLAVTTDLLYAGCTHVDLENSYLMAIDAHTGKVKWTQGNGLPFWGIIDPVIGADGVIYGPTSAHVGDDEVPLIGVDPKGKVIWSYGRNNTSPFRSVAIAEEGTMYAVNYHTIYKLKAK